MRPRFRSRSGPNAPRDGRPLELVRVRGSQRDARPEGRNVERGERGARRSRRRGGRGQRPPAPARRPGFLDWLKGLFGAAKPAPQPGGRGRHDKVELGDQESRAFSDFSKQYGITFRDPLLLKLALTHRSYLHVTGQGPRESNERLEFLGDSVLGLVTSEFLYRSHPSEHEGQLTKTKSLLVSKAILSRRALAMGLGRFVLMSHAEVESGGRQRLSILADAFESVIGAIYLDQGFGAAQAFIERWLLRESKVIAADRRHTNYKSHLQEYVQSTFRTHPVYRIRHEMGPDHSKQFMVEVMVGRRSLGEGRGQNKKEAEQAAARNALEAVESGPISDREKRRVDRNDPREETPSESRAASTARTVLPEPDADADDDAGEGDDRGRRRRRGRRGGRGRRDRPEGSLGAASTPGPLTVPERGEREERGPREPRADRGPRDESRAAEERGARAARPESSVRPSATPRFVRPDREAEGRAAMPVLPPEIEPVPPAHEEDENEEVGRPEGPRDDRRVEPYVWQPRPAPATPPVTAPAAMTPPPARVEPAMKPAWEPEAESPMEPAGEPAGEPEVEPAWEPEHRGPSSRHEVELEKEIEVFAPPEPEFEAARPDPEPPRAAQDDDEADEGPRYPETGPPPTPPPAPPAPTWGRRGRRGR